MWIVEDHGLLSFIETLDFQHQYFNQVKIDKEKKFLIFVEHKPVYTIGKNSKIQISEIKNIPVIKTERGGDITYHGPGQIVIYPIFNLNQSKIGPKKYIQLLEEIIIDALKTFKINATTQQTLPGVWIDNRKIASIGVRIKHGITFHGLALNVSTDLNYFNYITPCGIDNLETTSISKELGKKIAVHDIKDKIVKNFQKLIFI